MTIVRDKNMQEEKKNTKWNQNEMRQEEKMTMVSSEEQERGPGEEQRGTLRKAGHRRESSTEQRKFSLLLKAISRQIWPADGWQRCVFVKPTGRVH